MDGGSHYWDEVRIRKMSPTQIDANRFEYKCVWNHRMYVGSMRLGCMHWLILNAFVFVSIHIYLCPWHYSKNNGGDSGTEIVGN